MGGGVLFQLQLRGLLCSCCFQRNNGEDANARQALTTLNRSCRSIQVRVTKNSNAASSGGSGSAAGSSMAFLGNLFSGSNNAMAPSTAATSASSSNNDATPYLAKLMLRDSAVDGQPEILVEPLSRITTGSSATAWEDDDDENDTHDRRTPPQTQTGPKSRNVKLRRVDKVLLDGDEIVLKSKGITSSSSPSKSSSFQRQSRELLRFVVLQGDASVEAAASSSVAVPVTSDTRNELVHHFMVLTEWERQRKAALLKADNAGESYDNDSEEDDDEDEDGHQHASSSHRFGGAAGNFITARAQKMAHFAQREIELQRTKTQREQRKAQLLKEAGGLKYTAMAMANMSTTSTTNQLS